MNKNILLPLIILGGGIFFLLDALTGKKPETKPEDKADDDDLPPGAAPVVDAPPAPVSDAPPAPALA
jgi:hypothetical protein